MGPCSQKQYGAARSAKSGYITTQATLLLPAFILAEATLSFVGLGFPSTVATWGTMLRDAENVATLGDAPWALAPAGAIVLVVLGVNLGLAIPSPATRSTMRHNA